MAEYIIDRIKDGDAKRPLQQNEVHTIIAQIVADSGGGAYRFQSIRRGNDQIAAVTPARQDDGSYKIEIETNDAQLGGAIDSYNASIAALPLVSESAVAETGAAAAARADEAAAALEQRELIVPAIDEEIEKALGNGFSYDREHAQIKRGDDVVASATEDGGNLMIDTADSALRANVIAYMDSPIEASYDAAAALLASQARFISGRNALLQGEYGMLAASEAEDGTLRVTMKQPAYREDLLRYKNITSHIPDILGAPVTDTGSLQHNRLVQTFLSMDDDRSLPESTLRMDYDTDNGKREIWYNGNTQEILALFDAGQDGKIAVAHIDETILPAFLARPEVVEAVAGTITVSHDAAAIFSQWNGIDPFTEGQTSLSGNGISATRVEGDTGEWNFVLTDGDDITKERLENSLGLAERVARDVSRVGVTTSSNPNEVMSAIRASYDGGIFIANYETLEHVRRSVVVDEHANILAVIDGAVNKINLDGMKGLGVNLDQLTMSSASIGHGFIDQEDAERAIEGAFEESSRFKQFSYDPDTKSASYRGWGLDPDHPATAIGRTREEDGLWKAEIVPSEPGASLHSGFVNRINNYNKDESLQLIGSLAQQGIKLSPGEGDDDALYARQKGSDGELGDSLRIAKETDDQFILGPDLNEPRALELAQRVVGTFQSLENQGLIKKGIATFSPEYLDHLIVAAGGTAIAAADAVVPEQRISEEQGVYEVGYGDYSKEAAVSTAESALEGLGFDRIDDTDRYAIKASPDDAFVIAIARISEENGVWKTRVEKLNDIPIPEDVISKVTEYNGDEEVQEAMPFIASLALQGAEIFSGTETDDYTLYARVRGSDETTRVGYSTDKGRGIVLDPDPNDPVAMEVAQKARIAIKSLHNRGLSTGLSLTNSPGYSDALVATAVETSTVEVAASGAGVSSSASRASSTPNGADFTFSQSAYAQFDDDAVLGRLGLEYVSFDPEPAPGTAILSVSRAGADPAEVNIGTCRVDGDNLIVSVSNPELDINGRPVREILPELQQAMSVSAPAEGKAAEASGPQYFSMDLAPALREQNIELIDGKDMKPRRPGVYARHQGDDSARKIGEFREGHPDEFEINPSRAGQDIANEVADILGRTVVFPADKLTGEQRSGYQHVVDGNRVLVIAQDQDELTTLRGLQRQITIAAEQEQSAGGRITFSADRAGMLTRALAGGGFRTKTESAGEGQPAVQTIYGADDAFNAKPLGTITTGGGTITIASEDDGVRATANGVAKMTYTEITRGELADSMLLYAVEQDAFIDLTARLADGQLTDHVRMLLGTNGDKIIAVNARDAEAIAVINATEGLEQVKLLVAAGDEPPPRPPLEPEEEQVVKTRLLTEEQATEFRNLATSGDFGENVLSELPGGLEAININLRGNTFQGWMGRIQEADPDNRQLLTNQINYIDQKQATTINPIEALINQACNRAPSDPEVAPAVLATPSAETEASTITRDQITDSMVLYAVGADQFDGLMSRLRDGGHINDVNIVEVEGDARIIACGMQRQDAEVLQIMDETPGLQSVPLLANTTEELPSLEPQAGAIVKTRFLTEAQAIAFRDLTRPVSPDLGAENIETVGASEPLDITVLRRQPVRQESVRQGWIGRIEGANTDNPDLLTHQVNYITQGNGPSMETLLDQACRRAPRQSAAAPAAPEPVSGPAEQPVVTPITFPEGSTGRFITELLDSGYRIENGTEIFHSSFAPDGSLSTRPEELAPLARMTTEGGMVTVHTTDSSLDTFARDFVARNTSVSGSFTVLDGDNFQADFNQRHAPDFVVQLGQPRLWVPEGELGGQRITIFDGTGPDAIPYNVGRVESMANGHVQFYLESQEGLPESIRQAARQLLEEGRGNNSLTIDRDQLEDIQDGMGIRLDFSNHNVYPSRSPHRIGQFNVKGDTITITPSDDAPPMVAQVFRDCRNGTPIDALQDLSDVWDTAAPAPRAFASYPGSSFSRFPRSAPELTIGETYPINEQNPSNERIATSLVNNTFDNVHYHSVDNRDGTHTLTYTPSALSDPHVVTLSITSTGVTLNGKESSVTAVRDDAGFTNHLAIAQAPDGPPGAGALTFTPPPYTPPPGLPLPAAAPVVALATAGLGAGLAAATASAGTATVVAERPLQPAITEPHIEHNDGVDHILRHMPASYRTDIDLAKLRKGRLPSEINIYKGDGKGWSVRIIPGNPPGTQYRTQEDAQAFGWVVAQANGQYPASALASQPPQRPKGGKTDPHNNPMAGLTSYTVGHRNIANLFVDELKKETHYDMAAGGRITTYDIKEGRELGEEWVNKLYKRGVGSVSNVTVIRRDGDVSAVIAWPDKENKIPEIHYNSQDSDILPL